MKHAGWWVLLLALVVLPFAAGEYYINFTSQIFIAVIFAASLNLLVGYGGLPSLGHAAYLGVSAYLSAWLYLKLGLGALDDRAARARCDDADGGAVRTDRAARDRPRLSDADARAVAGVVGHRVPLGVGDRRRQRAARASRARRRSASASTTRWRFIFSRWRSRCIALWLMARFVGSPFGAALNGTRDQARRMSALGHDVWLIRWITFVYAGFWGAVSGLLFVYYHKYIHPASLSLTSSAEGLIGVIAGGSGTLAGPLIGAAIVMVLKNYVSALHRALEHAARLRLRRHRDLHARRPGAGRAPPVGALAEPMTAALEIRGTEEIVRRPAGDERRLAHGHAGRAPPDHRAQRRRQDHAVQPDHRRPQARQRHDPSVRRGGAAHAAAPARAPRARAHLPDHHAVRARHARAQRRAVAARPVQGALEHVRRRSAASGISTPRRARCSRGSVSSIWRSGR